MKSKYILTAILAHMICFQSMKSQVNERKFDCICQKTKEYMSFVIKDSDANKTSFYFNKDSIVFYSRKSGNTFYIKSDSLNNQNEIELYDLKKDTIGMSKIIRVPVFGVIQTFCGMKRISNRKYFVYKYDPIVLQHKYFPKVIIDEKFKIIEFDFYNGSQLFSCLKKK